MKSVKKLALTLKRVIRDSDLTPGVLEKRTGIPEDIIKYFPVTDNLSLARAPVLSSFFSLQLTAVRAAPAAEPAAPLAPLPAPPKRTEPRTTPSRATVPVSNPV